MSEELTDYTAKEKYTFYKIIVSPFSKADAQLIINYLRAFEKNKTIELEGIS